MDQLVQLTASAPITVGPASPPQRGSDADIGWLNLNRLLDAPHQNAYLWAALTLLGVLLVWAGLRIQGRRASPTLSTLMPSADMSTPSTGIAPNLKLELPADITALDLNLNTSAQSGKVSGQFRSPTATETLQ